MAGSMPKTRRIKPPEPATLTSCEISEWFRYRFSLGAYNPGEQPPTATVAEFKKWLQVRAKDSPSSV